VKEGKKTKEKAKRMRKRIKIERIKYERKGKKIKRRIKNGKKVKRMKKVK